MDDRASDSNEGAEDTGRDEGDGGAEKFQEQEPSSSQKPKKPEKKSRKNNFK